MTNAGTTSGQRLRIAVVNWQCRDNPLAGGAEIHLHEIFGRLAAIGHEVVLLCGGWPGCPPRATLDGIEVHRVGTRQTFPFFARRYWHAHLAGRGFDVLVEDINKVPLYTPTWRAPKLVGLVPHLFGGTAFQELAAPLATAVWLAEKPLPWFYRRQAFEAISESTKADLVHRGIAADRIRVIFPGIDSQHYTPDPALRADRPVFAYLGRLKKYKGVDLVLRAFAASGVEEATLEVAGAGEFRAELERLAGTLGVASRVRFLGRIDETHKCALLRRAWATVFASPKEGWGITNLEAAASGTPVIASNSPGIRESVKHGETGFLVPHGDVAAMAACMRRLSGERTLVEHLGVAARRFAEGFTWANAADQTEAHLREVVGREEGR
ncbi:MAG: glycosyltransferase family 4 protein [Gemmatimonadaceae bacterium]|uniref:glycosyltransferase family 4 protein n=1 Tax=Gemmatimonas sp. TaxID=1962908 RepID=UPI00391FA41B|nr:glycosyltransferase family 4 protein [Gemmatimonadota bacterium]